MKNADELGSSQRRQVGRVFNADNWSNAWLSVVEDRAGYRNAEVAIRTGGKAL